jgi:phosphohistidine phosphatase
MKLWVLRHGEAHTHAASDAVRELTALGREQVLLSAARLSGQPLTLLASPYVRAQQSAELVRQALGVDQVVTVPWLTPDSDPLKVIAGLADYPAGDVLLISHQPLVGALISVLVQGNYRHPQPMGTASLARLEGDAVVVGKMLLSEVFHP